VRPPRQLIIKEIIDGVLIHVPPVLAALGDGYRDSGWIIHHTEHEYFYATGDGGVLLESLAEQGARLTGPELRAVLDETIQVIWGRFTAVTDDPERQLTLDVIDSSFYEVTSNDNAALENLIRHFPASAFLDPEQFRR